MNKYVCIIVVLGLCFSCSDGFAAKKKYKKVPGGLGSLMEISKSQKEMESILAKETKIYKKVKRAFDSNLIKVGDSRVQLSGKFGEPVVKLRDEIKNTEKWIYKPGNMDYFSGNQIRMVFDHNGELVSIGYLPESHSDEKPYNANE